MTKAEALRAILQGQKVRYRTWWWGKYLKKYGQDRIQDEAGLVHSPASILTEDTGWELYDEEKHGPREEEKPKKKKGKKK